LLLCSHAFLSFYSLSTSSHQTLPISSPPPSFFASPFSPSSLSLPPSLRFPSPLITCAPLSPLPPSLSRPSFLALTLFLSLAFILYLSHPLVFLCPSLLCSVIPDLFSFLITDLSPLPKLSPYLFRPPFFFSLLPSVFSPSLCIPVLSPASPFWVFFLPFFLSSCPPPFMLPVFFFPSLLLLFVFRVPFYPTLCSLLSISPLLFTPCVTSPTSLLYLLLLFSSSFFFCRSSSFRFSRSLASCRPLFSFILISPFRRSHLLFPFPSALPLGPCVPPP